MVVAARCQKRKVYYLPEPGKDFLARPTLRIIDGILWLSQQLHPEDKKQLQAWHDESIAQLHACK